MQTNLTIDLRAVELRILSNEGPSVDIHMQTAIEMFNCTPNEVTPERRRQAKAVNYMSIYAPRYKV